VARSLFLPRPGTPPALHSFPTRRSSDLGFRDDPDSRLRSVGAAHDSADVVVVDADRLGGEPLGDQGYGERDCNDADARESLRPRSEEHTSELQSRSDLVCRLLLEKKKKN